MIMPGRTSHYSKDFNNTILFETLSILSEAQESGGKKYLTLEEIQGRSQALIGVSTQKLARTMSTHIEAGIATKRKSNCGKMEYTLRTDVYEEPKPVVNAFGNYDEETYDLTI